MNFQANSGVALLNHVRILMYFDRVDIVGWVKIRETADAPWRALEPRELVPQHALRLLPPLRRRLRARRAAPQAPGPAAAPSLSLSWI